MMLLGDKGYHGSLRPQLCLGGAEGAIHRPDYLKLPITVISTPLFLLLLLLGLLFTLHQNFSFFFKKITVQLVAGAEEWDMNLCNKEAIFNKNSAAGTILFVGESFARICRRGSAGILDKYEHHN